MTEQREAQASEEEEEQQQQGSEGSDAEASGGGDAEASEEEQVKKEMEKLEEDPPESLEDWPQGKAKYETYGGPEGEHGYHEGPEEKLGPSSVRHHEGGDVSVAGEKVDNPEEYKGEPIPGGPTDPDSPDASGETDSEDESSDD